MTVVEILLEARRQRIRLTAPGENRLHVSAPPGALTAEMKATLTARKPELLMVLWRLEGMRANVGKVPIPCAAVGARGGPGRCFSCGEPLDHPQGYGRCPPCGDAGELFYAEVPDAADLWHPTPRAEVLA